MTEGFSGFSQLLSPNELIMQTVKRKEAKFPNTVYLKPTIGCDSETFGVCVPSSIQAERNLTIDRGFNGDSIMVNELFDGKTRIYGLVDTPEQSAQGRYLGMLWLEKFKEEMSQAILNTEDTSLEVAIKQSLKKIALELSDSFDVNSPNLLPRSERRLCPFALAISEPNSRSKNLKINFALNHDCLIYKINKNRRMEILAHLPVNREHVILVLEQYYYKNQIDISRFSDSELLTFLIQNNLFSQEMMIDNSWNYDSFNPYMGQLDLSPGEFFVMCSDGGYPNDLKFDKQSQLNSAKVCNLTRFNPSRGSRNSLNDRVKIDDLSVICIHNTNTLETSEIDSTSVDSL